MVLSHDRKNARTPLVRLAQVFSTSKLQIATWVIESSRHAHCCVCCVSLVDSGYNQWGELGLEDQDDRGDDPNEMGDNLPFVDLGDDAKVVSVACGDWHT